MQGVIVEAVKRLTDISYLARKAARFAEENPNKLMFLDTNIQSDSSLLMKSLTEIEIGNILGIDGRNGINTKWFKKLMNENNGIITYDTLGRFLYRKYTFHKKVVTLFKSYDLLFYLYLIHYLKNSSFSIVNFPILSFEYELPLYLFQSVNTVSNSLSDFSCRYSFEILYFSSNSLVCF